LFAIGNEDLSILRKVRFEVLSLEEESSLITLADLFVLIQDVSEVAGHSRLVDEGERAFLDDGPSIHPIANELYYEEAYFVFQRREVEGLYEFLVGSLSVLILGFFCCDQSIQVHARVEGSQSLLVVSLRVELKDLHVESLDVFEFYLHIYLLLHLEELSVAF